MEKVKFVDPDTGEALAFFVVEGTKVGGTHYLLAVSYTHLTLPTKRIV